ncbi:MAG TPA: hypothetical protein VKU00_28455, partial [Chthonomonadaceae bacterium]|nr:hypothetical protein [Chthonomonadaceae bacterium]
FSVTGIKAQNNNGRYGLFFLAPQRPLKQGESLPTRLRFVLTASVERWEQIGGQTEEFSKPSPLLTEDFLFDVELPQTTSVIDVDRLSQQYTGDPEIAWEGVWPTFDQGVLYARAQFFNTLWRREKSTEVEYYPDPDNSHKLLSRSHPSHAGEYLKADITYYEAALAAARSARDRQIFRANLATLYRQDGQTERAKALESQK